MPEFLHIAAFTDPAFGENAYVVDCGEGGPCWIIDPGLPPSARNILAQIRRRRLTADAIVLTHAHADHIAGIPEILAGLPGLPVHIAAAERRALTDPNANLSAACGLPFAVEVADIRDLEPPGPIRLGDTSWDIFDTSGHSPGGRSLYCAAAGVVIVGDALFEGSIGRTDFPNSDHDRLIRNIRQHLLTLPDETKVYSGHGPVTTIGHERATNPFLTPF
jgi:glyoxylase-like metal-dependent hydrolase (beta-lactamase superfamily II)